MADSQFPFPVTTNNQVFDVGSGTFVPMTQPGAGGGGLTNGELRASPVPVLATIDTTGLATELGQTFLLAELELKADLTETQPVSLASVPTHGVTGPLTDTQLRAAAVPVSVATVPSHPVTNAGTFPVQVTSAPTTAVTGTFFQATQPVSLATAPTTPVTGTFFQATQPVSAATLPLPAGAATAALQAIPALTKGTQGATGYSMQALKDAGRNQTNFFMVLGIAGTASEVMQSLTGYKSGAAVAATVTPAVVTAGKTFRVTAVALAYQSLASAGGVLFRLRANLSGAGVVGSPLVAVFAIGSAAAVAGITTVRELTYPDGIEFAAGTGIAVGMVGINTVGAAAASGFGMITITGYEY